CSKLSKEDCESRQFLIPQKNLTKNSLGRCSETFPCYEYGIKYNCESMKDGTCEGSGGEQLPTMCYTKIIGPQTCAPTKNKNQYNICQGGKIPGGGTITKDTIDNIPVKCSDYKTNPIYGGCNNKNTNLLYDNNDGRHRVLCCRDPPQ
ncbi:MAG: hypothetical protein V3W20_02715, partial [Candidatus Neomarinimicrobiota bacterium]